MRTQLGSSQVSGRQIKATEMNRFVVELPKLVTLVNGVTKDCLSIHCLLCIDYTMTEDALVVTAGIDVPSY